SISDTYRQASPATAETYGVYVEDVTAPEEVTVKVPAWQVAGRPFRGLITCSVTDNNPNLETIEDRLRVRLETIPPAADSIHGSLLFSNYSARGFGEGQTPSRHYSVVTCDTETDTPPVWRTDFKGYILAAAVTEEGFGGAARGQAEEPITVYDMTRPVVLVTMSDVSGERVHQVGPVSAGSDTDTDTVFAVMPGTWFEDRRYRLTVETHDNIERFNSAADPASVRDVPNRHVRYAGYYIGDKPRPTPADCVDITAQIIEHGRAESLEIIFRNPGTVHLWLIVRDNAAGLDPRSRRDNVRILKIRLTIADTVMRTDTLD
ncbi:MAG: hypothetical protein QGH40_01365, partial [bacterium]|nr:hypothetical protein [bacterium]